MTPLEVGNEHPHLEAPMRKAQIIVAVATLIGSIQALAPAEQEAKQEQEVHYEVWGTSEKEPSRQRPWSDKQFDKQADAQNEIAEIQDSFAKLLKSDSDKPLGLWVKTITEAKPSKLKEAKEAALKVKEAKEATDKAKEIQKKGLTAEERKLGDTLKEYTKRIEDTFKNIKTLESKMKSTVGKISQKQFDEVNKLIASYNQSRNEIRRVERELIIERGGTPTRSRSRQGNPQANASVLDKFPMEAPLDPKDFKDKLEPEKPTGKYVVWVYKQVGNKWEKQEDESFSSDDQEQAEKYFTRAKVRAGYTATSNLPKAEQNPVGTYQRQSSYNGEQFIEAWKFKTERTATRSNSFQPGSSYHSWESKHKWDIRDGNVYVYFSDETTEFHFSKESCWFSADDGSKTVYTKVD
jgi:uncharacterized protein (UPF0297 family)